VEDDYMKRFIHLSAHSLPRLLALLLHPPTGFPPEDTSLLVVDSISPPFLSYFPQTTELKSKFDQQKVTDNQQLQWLLNRRRNILNELVSHLLKLAASRRLAVLLLNQTHTKVRGLARPTLYPALAGPWETNVHTRILLYRDWLPTGPQATGNGRVVNSPRIAEVTKKGGKALLDRTEENIVLFFIETNKLREMKTEETPTNLPRVTEQPAPEKWRKRKAEVIADSQDELEEGSEADDDWIKEIEAGLVANEVEGEGS